MRSHVLHVLSGSRSDSFSFNLRTVLLWGLLASLTLILWGFDLKPEAQSGLFFVLVSLLFWGALFYSISTGALKLRAFILMLPLLLAPAAVEWTLFRFSLPVRDLFALYIDEICLLALLMVSVLCAACLREFTAAISPLKFRPRLKQLTDFLLALPLAGAVGLLPWGYLSAFALNNSMLSDYDLLALIQTDGSEAWYFILDHAAYPLRIAVNLTCVALYLLGIWFLGSPVRQPVAVGDSAPATRVKPEPAGKAADIPLPAAALSQEAQL